jgi:PEP-CTERM motif-containing protein
VKKSLIALAFAAGLVSTSALHAQVVSIDGGAMTARWYAPGDIGTTVDSNSITIAPSTTIDLSGAFVPEYENTLPANAAPNPDGSFIDTTLLLKPASFEWTPDITSESFGGETYETVNFTTSTDTLVSVTDLGSNMAPNDFSDILVDGGNYEHFVMGDGTVQDNGPFIVPAGSHTASFDYVTPNVNGGAFTDLQLNFVAVPEPATLSLAAIASVGLLARRRSAK